MPYTSIENLPLSIRNHLPVHAQEIYMNAFNNALELYDEEEVAFRVAWAAVNKQYEKSPDGRWREKSLL